MSRIAYYRVSTREQSIEAQRTALGGRFDREFVDERVSGATLARNRAGFAAMLDYVREGDTLCVAAVDRLGRDALDVQQNVRTLIGKGVIVDVRGIGPIARGAGELVIAVLSQIAQMERDRIFERCDAGRAAARASLAENGKTHRGKSSLGRRPVVEACEIVAWRRAHQASISETARHFQVSASTVKRAFRAHAIADSDAAGDDP